MKEMIRQGIFVSAAIAAYFPPEAPEPQIVNAMKRAPRSRAVLREIPTPAYPQTITPYARPIVYGATAGGQKKLGGSRQAKMTRPMKIFYIIF